MDGGVEGRGQGIKQHGVNDADGGEEIVGKSWRLYRDTLRALLNRKREDGGRGNDGSILLYNVRLPITVLRNDV